VITLHQFPTHFGIHISVSPFCAKLEAYFKLAGVEYEIAPGDVRKAPSGKVPYIVDGSTEMGDSTRVIEWCKSKYGDPLDGRLSAAEHGRGHMIQVLVEDHLYWALLYSRFQDPAGWEKQIAVVHKILPPFLRPFLTNVVRKATVKQIHQHGLGRLSRDEVYAVGVRDLDALEDIIGDQPFFLGEAPTSYDCAVYGQVQQVIVTESDNPLTVEAKKRPKLVAWLGRMNEKLGW